MASIVLGYTVAACREDIRPRVCKHKPESRDGDGRKLEKRNVHSIIIMENVWVLKLDKRQPLQIQAPSAATHAGRQARGARSNQQACAVTATKQAWGWEGQGQRHTKHHFNTQPQRRCANNKCPLTQGVWRRQCAQPADAPAHAVPSS